MKQSIKKFFTLATLMFVASVAFAQVTTSSMSGNIKEANGEIIPGAAVIAVHIPSGTEYYATSNSQGYYRIHNMRVGGPYSIKVSFLGYGEMKAEGFTLKLGENFVYDVTMKEEAFVLEGAIISAGVVNPILNSDKAGTSTNISSSQITALPTISRSITSFTALTPQAYGNSFSGKDSRMNNFTVDGAGFNNNFGLNSSMPGGGQPISLDAIEEISVNIAPYDVRQSRFTGAAINAITKGGTNKYTATAYTFQKFKSFNGSTVNGVTVNGANESNQQVYGASISGPIIKDKLFLFVNGELDSESRPGVLYTPSTDGVGDGKYISRTSESDLQRVKDYLINQYNYDPGKYKDWDPFSEQNYKIMARLDWNINQNHKAMIRFNEVQNSYDNVTNGNSGPPGLPRLSNRMSSESIAFSNNFYKMNNLVRSITGELNSTFSDKISNKFLATYTHIRDYRTSPSNQIFPHVDILKDGDTYMSFGTELFTYNNEVLNNTWSIINNTTISLNKHTITAGLSYENLFVKNSYIREGTSYYRYASVDDFINNAAPVGFGLTYGYDGETAPGQMLTFGTASAYVQDEWNITPKFKLTYGVRFDLPMYLDELITNEKIKELTAVYPSGAWDVGQWPTANLLVNPRVGFNWDVLGDRSFQIRGGTGLFSGALPFVWFTNQVAGGGMIQSPEIGWNATTIAANGLTFNPDYRDLMASMPTHFPQQPDANYLADGASISMVDKDFKMPQVWRTNLAVDVELPWNTIFTGEVLYSKDINGVGQKNLNEAEMTQKLYGADNRPAFLSGSNRVVSSLRSASYLTNVSGGYQFQATAQLTKNFTRGLSGMFAYTYTNSKDLSSNPGSSAYSAWSSNTAVNSLNDPGLSYSNFSVPHRLVGNISYRIEYANHLATTVSLVYQGSHTGRWSYTYKGDLNGDGLWSDLMYIPADPSEINFVDIVDKNGNVTATAAAQSEAFFNYVNNNSYLSSKKGDYVDRFGGLKKWRNQFDVKIIQDIFMNFGSDDRLSLQASLDIMNFGNMINDSWGTYEYNGLSNYDNIRLLDVVSKGTSTTAPTFRLNASSVENFEQRANSTYSTTIGSTWGMLLGLRLTF